MRNNHGEIVYQFIHILEMTEVAKILWLENETIDSRTEYFDFSFDENPEDKNLKLTWNRQNIEEIVETIREQGSMQDITMTPSVVWQSDEIVKVTWKMQKGYIYAPLYMRIQRRNTNDIYPESRMYQIMEGNSVELLHLPAEYSALNHIVAIIEELELITDMGHYLYLYEELGREAFSGRKMFMILKNKLENEKIPLDRKRIDILIGYGSYTYMKKRFHSYVKKRSDVTWEEAFSRIMKFLRPILDAIVSEDLFLGDWMPNLGRYLD